MESRTPPIVPENKTPGYLESISTPIINTTSLATHYAGRSAAMLAPVVRYGLNASTSLFSTTTYYAITALQNMRQITLANQTTENTAIPKQPSAKFKPNKQKTKRQQTTFQSNITASLIAAKKNVELEGKSFLYNIASHTYSAIKHRLFKLPEDAKPKRPTVDEEMKLFHDEMEKLETAFQKEEDKSIDADDIVLKKVEMQRAQIIEHAARRADIFFYLLIAVKGTRLVIREDETVKQHGKGSKERGTQACHSSMFPNLILEEAEESKSKGMMSYLFRNKPEAPRSLKGTYFEEVMNITTELPSIVNGFDGHLEGRFQLTEFSKDCLRILNRVSNDEQDPILAMNDFYKVMFSFFDHIRRNYLEKPHRMDYPKAFPKVWEYEREGTFIGADLNTLTTKDDYIKLMLRISGMGKFTSKFSLNSFYEKIQHEIYHSKSPLEESVMQLKS